MNASHPILPGAEPVFDPRNSEHGILFIHGFCGNPRELKSTAALFAGRHSVSVPRLAGHGTSVQDMARTNAADWIASARAACEELRGSCKEISILGFSMGGAIASILAAEFPVRRLALVSMPAYLSPWFTRPAAALGRFVKVLPLPWSGNLGLLDAAARREHVTYRNVIPLAQVYYLGRLLEQAREVLPTIACDALIVQSRRDGVIPRDSAELIHGELGSQQKDLRYLEDSDHLIPLDRSRFEFYDLIQAFLD